MRNTTTKPNIQSQLNINEKLVFINGHWAIVPKCDVITGKSKNNPVGGFIDWNKKNNSNLTTARRVKNNEYYMLYSQIENELYNYIEYFNNKTIYCPIDKLNYEKEQGFVDFFRNNMDLLGIKKIICTIYNPNGKGVVISYDNNSSIVQTLRGDGAFASTECKNYMLASDIIVTNPSFSTARLFISQLMELNKKFIIVGDVNMVPYKDVFKHIMLKKMWCGYTKPTYFATDLDNVIKETQYEENGVIYEKFGNKLWFTNLPVKKEKLQLNKTYNEKSYKVYDESNVIDVNKIKDIPIDFDGVMGVPVSFIEVYNPNQFEIVGRMNSNSYDGFACYAIIGGKNIYQRILIRKVK